VAWDGSIIHDRPKSVQVNNSSDRANKSNCRAVFERLFHRKEYAKWQIVQVFELKSISGKNYIRRKRQIPCDGEGKKKKLAMFKRARKKRKTIDGYSRHPL
jgi:hypothetical protein